MSHEPEPTTTTRRVLMRDLTLAGAAAAAAGVVPMSETAAAEAESKRPTEADARMDYLLARFGEHLDEAARKVVRSEVESQVRRSEQLRKLEADNGVGPFPVFRPYGPTD